MNIETIPKLGKILLSPIELLCDWGREPMRYLEHRRHEESLDNQVRRDIDCAIGAQRELSRLKQEEQESSTNLQIKRETEVVQIINEIEQLKKDKELERMKAVSDAMMKYQQELTRINVDAVDAIGSMRIELQRKAYDLIHEKTQKYAELQDKAIQQAQDQLLKIDSNCKMTDSTKEILRGAVDRKLAGIIENALRFIDQLNLDIQDISKDINLITSSGQGFIERHLSRFQVIGFSDETVHKLTGSGNRTESLPPL